MTSWILLADGLMPADDETKWQAAFPSGCKVLAKYRSCAICLAHCGVEEEAEDIPTFEEA